jgi:hypothetical protein
MATCSAMFWIFGVVFFLLAAGLLIAARFQKRRLDLMTSTETSTAAELRALAQSVAGEIGPGSFNQMVEVKGVIRCENPLHSELARVPCVHYSMQVTREYEETHWETDSKGNQVRRQHRASETMAENTRSCTFEVEDATGRVSVDPTGATITAEKACDRFERGESRSGSLSVGDWSFDLVSPLADRGGRTLGYRYLESVVPVGRPVFVLGEATDAEGQLVIRKPARPSKGGGFLVSTRSEEQLTQSARRNAKWLVVGTAVSAAGGTAMVLLGLLR